MAELCTADDNILGFYVFQQRDDKPEGIRSIAEQNCLQGEKKDELVEAFFSKKKDQLSKENSRVKYSRKMVLRAN